MSPTPRTQCSEIDRRRVAWHISTKSGSGSGGTCVEAGPVGDASGRVAVRHSRRPDGELLALSGASWESFVEAIKASTLR